MATSALMNVMVAAARKAGAQPRARFRRGRAAPGLDQGAGQFRHRGRPSGRGHHLQRAVQGAPRLRLPDGGARRDRGADKTHRWIVDPLDGTTNFLHGIPLFAISIALEREGQLVAGVIYNPVMDELYTAEKGKGAFLNDRRLRVAARRSAAGQRAWRPAFPIAAAAGTSASSSNARRPCARVSGIRRTGAACIDLAWTAQRPLRRLLGARSTALGHGGRHRAGARGGRDGVGPAGGAAMFESGDIAVGNPYVHKQLLGLLQQASAGAEAAG